MQQREKWRERRRVATRTSLAVPHEKNEEQERASERAKERGGEREHKKWKNALLLCAGVDEIRNVQRTPPWNCFAVKEFCTAREKNALQSEKLLHRWQQEQWNVTQFWRNVIWTLRCRFRLADTALGQYVPCAAPKIKRHENTTYLHWNVSNWQAWRPLAIWHPRLNIQTKVTKKLSFFSEILLLPALSAIRFFNVCLSPELRLNAQRQMHKIRQNPSTHTAWHISWQFTIWKRNDER